MKPFEINATVRDVQGKGASRRLRRAGVVPAVVYGGDKEPQNLQLDHNEVYLHTENEAFYSHILNLIVEGTSQRVVLRDMQRHPFKPRISHMDFQRIKEDEALSMRVPLHFINEEQCVGVKTGGGIISHLLTELEIVCLPSALPEYIEVDVLNLELGDSLHLSDIIVPEGVQIEALLHEGDPTLPVVSVQMPRVEVEPTEEEEAAEEGAEAPEAAADSDDDNETADGDD